MICGLPPRDFISLVIVAFVVTAIIAGVVAGLGFLAWREIREMRFESFCKRFWKRQGRRAVRP